MITLEFTAKGKIYDMKIAGIVAEYNPFHNGHRFQIEQTRCSGATHIVAVMSGSFVQRGDIAICSKWERAKACVLNGVDLVIELPVAYSLSTANIFAFASIYLLNQLNINSLSFGSECGNIDLLIETAKIIETVDNSQEIKNILSEGVSFPVARQKAINELYGEKFSKVIGSPNNVLGIEYIRAINKINPQISPITIEREQVEHDSSTTITGFASASKIRELLIGGLTENSREFMPQSVYDIIIKKIQENKAPISSKNIEQAMLYKLRKMTVEDFLKLPDVCEGLENRLYKSAQKATSIDEFFHLVKTKRYTLSRIRRIAYCALIGITKEIWKIEPQYIRVLGSNEKGMEIIKQAKKTATIPIGTKFADLYKLNPNNFTLDIRATDIFSLATYDVSPCGKDFTENTIIIK